MAAVVALVVEVLMVMITIMLEHLEVMAQASLIIPDLFSGTMPSPWKSAVGSTGLFAGGGGGGGNEPPRSNGIPGGGGAGNVDDSPGSNGIDNTGGGGGGGGGDSGAPGGDGGDGVVILRYLQPG